MLAEMATNWPADLGDVWPPGFRFHPTDEELVLYYLKRKICRQRLKLDVVSEVDVYKWDPEELPGMSLLKTGDRQWFFFCPRDKKQPNGSRSNRASPHGYWKTTGKDRNISYYSRPVGVKKTLVFYKGRAPSGERTDWVMHEYTLEETELKRCKNVQGCYAMYKLFKKSGAGPKNGEEYGAPFREDDWDDDVPVVSNYIDSDSHVDLSIVITSADMRKNDAQDMHPVVCNDSDSHVNQSIVIASADMRKNDAQASADMHKNNAQASADMHKNNAQASADMQLVVYNYIESDSHVNQSIDIASEDMHKNDAQASADMHKNNAQASADMHEKDAQVQCTWDDIQEFMKQFAEDPAPEGSGIGDCGCAMPQVFGEEGQSTITDLLLGKDKNFDPSGMHPPSNEQNIQGSSSFTLLAASEVQSQNVYGVVSSGVNEQQISEEDFLEIDDLLGSEFTHDIGEFIPQPSGELGVTSEWGDHSGLNELDLYYDAGLFLRELSPINQATALHSYAQSQASQLVTPYDLERTQPSSAMMNNIGPQQQPISDQNYLCATLTESNPEATPFPTGDLCGSNFTPNATEFQNGKGVEAGEAGDDAWFISALWSSVESIPTTPASAADSSLVNKAFEGMSSFTQLRLDPKSATAAAIAEAATSRPPGGRMMGFFLLSFMGALFAVLFFLMGVFGKMVLPGDHVMK